MQAQRITGFDRLFHPKCPEFITDPYALYREAYASRMCFVQGRKLWLAMHHKDITQMLRDPRFGHMPERVFEYVHGPGINEEPVIANFNRMMLVRNDPDHSRLRSLVNRAFNARRVIDMKPSIERIPNRLIYRMSGAGEV
ncbi:MAG: hypothetical protein OXT09_01855, partial [Myxococcales bacterium]|nr:hypothetical protein [Myxococcales bacterium]